MWHPQSSTLKNIRDFLANNPATWTKATRAKAFRERFEFWGTSLTRAPRGFDPAHPLVADLMRRNFAAGQSFPDAIAQSDELLPCVVDPFQQVAPLVDFLCAAFGC